MTSPIAAIARLTVLECRGARCLAAVLGLVLCALVGAASAAALALAGKAEFFATFYASIFRPGGVTLLAASVAFSLSVERQGGLLEMTLAGPVTRGQWYWGRLCGFLLLALLLAASGSFPVFCLASLWAATAWSISLGAEFCVVVAAASMFATTIRQPPLVVVAVLAFYLLARSGEGLVLLATASGGGSVSADVIGGLIRVIAVLLPALGRQAQTLWFVAPPGALELARLITEALIGALMLTAIGLYDVYRRKSPT